MKTEYNVNKYRKLFIEKAKFAVPLELYLELTERQRMSMYLKTEYFLEQMDLVESTTLALRKNISERTATGLAKAVLVFCDAFNENLVAAAANKSDQNESADNDQLFTELNESEQYKAFKAFRFIQLENDSLTEIKEYLEENPEEISEFARAGLEIFKEARDCEYNERGLVYDYILESWHQAAKGFSPNSNLISVSDSIEIRNRKAAENKIIADRMKAYVGHLKGLKGQYTMS
ncbi:hypothetical protein FCL47_23595 [Desulfopila sp. IMCC35006]|uniref:hypothetical protein n=1 Tax=Desulfopila sp. IMCC35006 TaxID=2569542 RepID=UPI0010AB76B3|nr:hypothetical protein [Desulfopila sp. IMCC35006]TKB23200.1 hypothetical protein FCL47_23595 [Desulfopila sp. IMCC35006]